MSPTPPISIVFDAVTLNRGGRRVFDGLDLTLTERRIGLLGDNGAGKSSFLRLLNGLLLPDGGAVRVDGLDTRADRAKLPAKVGFVFQNPDHQIVFPTVLEELAFGLRERGASARAAADEARAILQAHGRAEWENVAVHELSEGQKQRLCILAVIAMRPDVIAMDEPFSSLDLPTRLGLADLLSSLPQRAVVASHDLDLLAQMDRVLWLDGGELRADGKPGDILPAYRDNALRRSSYARAAQ